MCAIIVYKDGFVKTISDITFFRYVLESINRKFVGPYFYIESEVFTRDGSIDTDCAFFCLSEIDSIDIFDNSLETLSERYGVLNG